MDFFDHFSKSESLVFAGSGLKVDVIGCGITGHCSHTLFLRFRGENHLVNQIARFFKLVYLLNHLTVFCNFLHDGRKPFGEETEYALVVIRG